MSQQESEVLIRLKAQFSDVLTAKEAISLLKTEAKALDYQLRMGAITQKEQAEGLVFLNETAKNYNITRKQEVDLAAQIFHVNKRAENGYTDMSSALAQLGNGFKEIHAKALGMVAAFTAVITAFEGAEKAARLDLLSSTLSTMARKDGVEFARVMQDIDEKTNGVLSSAEKLNGVMRLNLSGIGFKELPEIMDFAEKRAKLLGQSFEETLNKIELAALGNKKALKGLLIPIDIEESYERYAKSIGVTKDELSEAGKKHAIFNAMLETGSKQMLSVNKEAAEQVDTFERLKSSVSDLSVELGRTLGMFAPILTVISKAVNIFNTALQDYNSSGGLGGASGYGSMAYRMIEYAQKLGIIDDGEGWSPEKRKNVASGKLGMISPRDVVKSNTGDDIDPEKVAARKKKEADEAIKQSRDRVSFAVLEYETGHKTYEELIEVLHIEEARTKILKERYDIEKKEDEIREKNFSKTQWIGESGLTLGNMRTMQTKGAPASGLSPIADAFQSELSVADFVNQTERQVAFNKKMAEEARREAREKKRAHEEDIRNWKEENQVAMGAIDSVKTGLQSWVSTQLMVTRQAKDGWDQAWIAMENTAINSLESITTKFMESVAVSWLMSLVNPIGGLFSLVGSSTSMGIPSGPMSPVGGGSLPSIINERRSGGSNALATEIHQLNMNLRNGSLKAKGTDLVYIADKARTQLSGYTD